MKRCKIFVGIAATIVAFLLIPTFSYADEFADALKKSQSFHAPYNEPEKIDQKIALYKELILKFQNHSELYRAKLAIFELYRFKEDYERSGLSIRDLLDETDVNSEHYPEIAFAYIDYQDQHRTAPFHDLAKAQETAEKLIDLSDRKQDKSLWLQARYQLGSILAAEKKYDKALDVYQETIDKADSWAKTGYYHDLAKKGMKTYTEVADIVRNCAAGLCGVLHCTSDVALFRKVQKKTSQTRFESVRMGLVYFKRHYLPEEYIPEDDVFTRDATRYNGIKFLDLNGKEMPKS